MKNLNHTLILLGIGLGITTFTGCSSAPEKPGNEYGNITKKAFGTAPDGQAVELYTLRNAKGAEVSIMTYGGIVRTLKMPDKKGQFADIVLGYDHLDGYLKQSPYFGALIGRYGNRIGGAKFTLDGQTYNLATNDGPNCLHGGNRGFDKVVWKAVNAVVSSNGPELELSYYSRDGEEGFPGNLIVSAVYTLTENDELRLDFTAHTDKPTVANLTHHSYFNLAGQGNGDILGHEVYINSDEFTPVDATLIPTGQLQPVEGTPFDFRTPTAIGARIDADNEQLKFGKGYDHNWVINKPMGQLGLMARVDDPSSGRVMEVFSTEPGLQFYSGNFLDGTIIGKAGDIYKRRYGFCMEPQHYPDSPNKPNFPSVELKPGETYHNTIIYKFSVK